MEIIRLYEIHKSEGSRKISLNLSLAEIGDDEWVCRVDFSGSGVELLKKGIFGIDALQAFENALIVVSATINNFEQQEAVRITWIGGDGSGIYH